MTSTSPLDGPDRSRARTWAIGLADELASGTYDLEDPSLASGSAGAAILFGNVYARTPALRWAAAADEAMSRAAAGIVERLGTHGIGLYSGLAGVAWAELIVDALLGRTPIVNPAVTDALQKVVDDADEWPWELTAGMVGVGVYAAHCVELGSPPQLLTSICERLLRESRDGTWITDGDLLFGAGQTVRPPHYMDLGMAHGIAGIVALAALAAAPGGPPVANELLTRSVAALGDGNPANGPAVDNAHLQSSLPPRWCYGDFGVTMALTLAHQRQPYDAGLGLLASRAMDIVTSAPTVDVTDLGLCHGLAGIALILGRLADVTDDPRCVHACRAWSARLLDRLDTLGRAADVLDATDPRLLEGAAGIALALLSLADAQPSDWQRMLLLR
jgi:lantibiotic modifying enzyme